jgi:hypothetical protein
LEALLARTAPQHSSYPGLKEKVRRRVAGFAGECQFDRTWHEFAADTQLRFIPDFKFAGHQIDALCIFPSFIVLVEVKNIGGFIQMDGKTRQFTRTWNGIMTGMANPDDQLYRHEKAIRRFISSNLPVIGIAVFTNPSAVLEVKNIKRCVLHISGLPFILDELMSAYKHSPKINIEHYFEYFFSLQPPLQTNQPAPIPYPLLSGVFCRQCPYVKMNYALGCWRCPSCKTKQADAHQFALQDYRLLIGPSISNREFRSFTGLQSRTNATVVLKSCGFQTVGIHKSTRYLIPELDLRKPVR